MLKEGINIFFLKHSHTFFLQLVFFVGTPCMLYVLNYSSGSGAVLFFTWFGGF